MNTEIRKLLVDRAHARSRSPVYYGEIARELGLSTESSVDRAVLSRTLGEIATYEQEQRRPLLSAIVTYNPGSRPSWSIKEKEDPIHGNGFYNIASELGLGDSRKLQKELFGIAEMNRCFDFWQDETNYQQYADLDQADVSFFLVDEITSFASLVDQACDQEKPAHQAAKENIINPLWDKTIYWANMLVAQLPGFVQQSKRNWTELGVRQQVFKHYTWARIFREGHDGRKIYFTVGVDGRSQELVYKLDFQVAGRSNLDKQQRQLIERERPAAAASWVGIHSTHLINYDWEQLVTESLNFIRLYTKDYDRLFRLIENTENLAGKLLDENQLIPTNTPEGWEEEPVYDPKFTPTFTDYEKEAREQKALGDQGEQLVIDFEKNALIAKGQPELAAEVGKADDGEGFDVRSFDENGDLVFIEVKTTKQGINTPFYLSRNELAFAKNNPTNYCIYRLYDYDPKLNTARYYTLQHVVDSIILQPTEYRVFPKKKPS